MASLSPRNYRERLMDRCRLACAPTIWLRNCKDSAAPSSTALCKRVSIPQGTLTAMPDSREEKLRELRAMQKHAGRFGLQGSGKHWRVVELNEASRPIPVGDWTDHATAMALRERLHQHSGEP